MLLDQHDMYLLTVIIPVKNGEATLSKCLSSIYEQTIADKLEVIILDSASTDNSVKMAEGFGAKIIHINPKEFNHGLTRNLGAQYALGNLLFYTTQDAYLAEKNQLKKMAAHFNDKALQAVAGMQAVPNDVDKNPAGWFKRISNPVTAYYHFPDFGYSKLSNKQQFQYTDAWDDVNAMYRLSALKALPFEETQFAEDKLWARDALLAGYKIAFDPSLLVYHYHHRDFSYSFKVRYIVSYHYYKYFRVYPSLPPFFLPLLTSWYRIFRNEKISFGKKFYWSSHNLTSLAGDYLSHLIFLVIAKLFSERVLEKSIRYFCGQVPQGKLKG